MMGAERTTPVFGGRIGRTYTLRELGAAVSSFAPLAPRAGLVWLLRRMDPGFREAIMLTVAKTNGCRYCSYIHQEWALRNGAGDTEIAELEGVGPAGFDRTRWIGLVYARSLAENDFATVAPEIAADAAAHYSPGELRNIEAVARVMTLVNRSANTMDALVERLRGRPASPSPAAELVITALLLVIGPPLVPVLSVILRKSPMRLLREFRTFTAGDSAAGAQAA